MGFFKRGFCIWASEGLGRGGGGEGLGRGWGRVGEGLGEGLGRGLGKGSGRVGKGLDFDTSETLFEEPH